MSDYWAKESDFEEDLWALSTCKPQLLKSVEVSSHLKKARTKRSIYDDDDVVEAEANYNGFGRGMSLQMDMPKPGGKPSFLKDLEKTSAEIRKVCGAGFSNELIEQQMKTHNNTDKQMESAKGNNIPDLSFQPVKSNITTTTSKYIKLGKPGKKSKDNSIKSNVSNKLELLEVDNVCWSTSRHNQGIKYLNMNCDYQFPKLS